MAVGTAIGSNEGMSSSIVSITTKIVVHQIRNEFS